MDWKGLAVTVKLVVVNRQATVSVIPSSSSLVMKALNEPPRDRKKVKHVVHDGNITLDQVIDVARIMRERSMARTMGGTVKEILGTCVSIGCTIIPKRLPLCSLSGSILACVALRGVDCTARFRESVKRRGGRGGGWRAGENDEEEGQRAGENGGNGKKGGNREKGGNGEKGVACKSTTS
eukprot:scaffold263_cov251-Pinguiococcus_pyrenoidosus.AAC.18